MTRIVEVADPETTTPNGCICASICGPSAEDAFTVWSYLNLVLVFFISFCFSWIGVTQQMIVVNTALCMGTGITVCTSTVQSLIGYQ